MNKIKNTTPILLPLLGLVAGIYCQTLIKAPIYFLASTLCILCAVLLIFVIKNKFSNFVKYTTFATFFVLGAFCYSLQKSAYKHTFNALYDQNMTIVARVSDKKTLPKKSRLDMAEIFYIDVEKIVDSKTSVVDFSLICYSRFNTDVQVGDEIELSNVKIKKTHSHSLSGNKSFQDYLYKEGFLSSVFLTKNNELKIIDRPERCWQRWLWEIKIGIYNDLHDKMDEQTFTYFALIFLGNTQQAEILQMRETFNYWGLSHYLARSGLHIVFFILIWTFLFRFIPIGINWKRLLLILLCLIYKLLSWSSIPFIRAFYVFLLMEGGKLFDLQTHFLHLLSIVCLTVLIFNPMQLFFLDFQLSFGLTFALSWALRYF